MRMQTLAVHAGFVPDATTGAVVPPIHLSTTFERAPDGSYPHGFIYGRSDNPNRQGLEQSLAALEGGAEAVTFASGTAAAAAVLQSLPAGAHVLFPTDVYYGTVRIVRELFEPWGLSFDQVDMTRPERVAAALRPETRLVWVETPGNPLLSVTPLAEVAAIARRAGALCVCDNTWATPVLQRPLEHGCDAVLHATTKYLGGHSDVVGGCVVVRERGELAERLRTVQVHGGAVPSPFDCWLLQRGIRTLVLRVRAHCEAAQRVAEFLAGQAAVAAVHYPGLPAHPGHAVARRQMTGGFGGMLSAQIRGGEKAAMTVAANLKLFTRATSLGGTESLVEHRASIEGPGTRTPPDLLRLSVGIEDPADLVADLGEALRAAD